MQAPRTLASSERTLEQLSFPPHCGAASRDGNDSEGMVLICGFVRELGFWTWQILTLEKQALYAFGAKVSPMSPENVVAHDSKMDQGITGRDDSILTCDIYVPNAGGPGRTQPRSLV
jgi:hypothetical protein